MRLVAADTVAKLATKLNSGRGIAVASQQFAGAEGNPAEGGSMEFEGRTIVGEDLTALIDELRVRRRETKAGVRDALGERKALTNAQRALVFAKTEGRCHICGGTIEGRWHADHVFPHSSGGAHAVDNYLPAHDVCNSYRWDYSPDEFQLILKLGVWLKGEVLRQTEIGRAASDRFIRHQTRVARRRRPHPPSI